MSDKTGIEWTDATWNPIRGCSRVSAGCMNCYAERHATRFAGEGLPYAGLITNGKWNGKIAFVADHLYDPLRWSTPRRIFVNSMSDLFHENVPDDIVARVFAVMAWAHWKHKQTFQVLTKRPERMRALLTSEEFRYDVDCVTSSFTDDEDCPVARWLDVHDRRPDDARGMSSPQIDEDEWWPLPNVWLGVSVEDQATAAARIPLLLQTPAAKRFVSYEPALGPVDFSAFGVHASREEPSIGAWHTPAGQLVLGARPMLDWLICGGESGPGARPMHPDWARSARDQCVAAGIPFFFKQWGEWCFGAREDRDFVLMTADGEKIQGDEAWAVFHEKPLKPGVTTLSRVGKIAAGRILDGTQWHQFP